jgi:hypothetical protein
LIARTLFVQSLTRRGTARQGSRKFSSFCPHFSLEFSLHFQRECFAIVASDSGSIAFGKNHITADNSKC